MHLNARQYDPTVGRFISVDPILDLTDPQQWHAYTYANGSPVTNNDPTGLIPTCDNDGNIECPEPPSGVPAEPAPIEDGPSDSPGNDGTKNSDGDEKKDEPNKSEVTFGETEGGVVLLCGDFMGAMISIGGSVSPCLAFDKHGMGWVVQGKFGIPLSLGANASFGVGYSTAEDIESMEGGGPVAVYEYGHGVTTGYEVDAFSGDMQVMIKRGFGTNISPWLKPMSGFIGWGASRSGRWISW